MSARAAGRTVPGNCMAPQRNGRRPVAACCAANTLVANEQVNGHCGIRTALFENSCVLSTGSNMAPATCGTWAACAHFADSMHSIANTASQSAGSTMAIENLANFTKTACGTAPLSTGLPASLCAAPTTRTAFYTARWKNGQRTVILFYSPNGLTAFCSRKRSFDHKTFAIAFITKPIVVIIANSTASSRVASREYRQRRVRRRSGELSVHVKSASVA